MCNLCWGRDGSGGQRGAGRRSTVRALSPLGHREPGVSRSCRAAQAMDCEVSNGSGLRDECITNLLVFGFLQSCSDNSFRRELDALGRELPVPATQLGPELPVLATQQGPELPVLATQLGPELPVPATQLGPELPVPAAQWEAYDELQTDDSESQEDVIRNIARHLAQVGDSMDRSIPPGLVNGLALQLRNTSRSEEDRNRDLATALEQLLQAYPTDMEKEKTMLVLALLLAKKVASHTPSLLRDVFQTTVNFINQNLRAYVRSLARNGMD
ncbi:BH3-interacting domain death agonist isoform X2 [Chlorocebus sabaeus]|uniref:BH3-interacting domain death agonist isoform X2 n=1 Tax=Chlorocebus sabaeus TaxID=60711 RepID=UPI003BF9E33C